jgi:hypothetical protein
MEALVKKTVKLAFQTEVIEVSTDDIQYSKPIKASIKKTAKYRQVHTSISEVGIVEHLIIYRLNGRGEKFLLLDGHLRLEVLKSLGHKKVNCIVATDDEGFTYNHKISRLSAIQEHFMILKAIEKGLSEERIARALDVDVSNIRRKRRLLNGIDGEAVALLKDKQVSPSAFRILRRVTPERQIEMCELMIAAHNYTVPFTKALFAASPSGQLKEPQKKKKMDRLSAEKLARMKKETDGLVNDIKIVKESYGKDMLNLVLACGYLSRMLENGKVVQFLSFHYPDILSEFQKIIEATSLSN